MSVTKLRQNIHLYLGNGEEKNESDDEDGQQIEHLSHVGKRVEKNTELDGIEEAGDEEETAQNVGEMEETRDTNLNSIVDVIHGEERLEIQIQVLLEGVHWKSGRGRGI